jgi:cytosine deaminase
VHLDKCHSVDRCADVGGDLAAAGAAQRRDKLRWTPEDLAQRARRGLGELVQAGCGVVRTHVDWVSGDDAPEVPAAWDVIGALAEEAAEKDVILQRAALTGIDEMSDPARTEAVARRMARDGGVLGSFVLHHERSRDGVTEMFRAAETHGLALDFHVDEDLDPGPHGVEMIADVALHMGYEGPVLCGHACALASKPDDDVARIAEKLARAGIAVAALPATNLYLQGRRNGTPDLRGLTRLHELAAHGVTTVVGTDNVRDAYCPIGRHDPLFALSLAVLAGHLDPPFGRHLPMITSSARRAMGLAPSSVDGAAANDLIAYPAASLSELLAGPIAPIPLPDLPKVSHA